jgi:hypothetical protein
MDINKFKINKILGKGMYGTVYESIYKNKKYAYKIEHVLKTDIDNKSSNIWREIKFSEKFANEYPEQFITLFSYDIINNCKHKQNHIWNISFFNKKLQDQFIKLSKSKYCIRKVYSMIDYTLGEIINSLSKQQIYSMIIQFSYIIYLLEKNKYIHGDIHQYNIGVVLTKKKYIKIFQYNVPTYGYLYKLIDFGRVLHKKNIVKRGNIKIYKNLYGNELDFILTTMISNLPFINYINDKKIVIDEMSSRKSFPNTIESNILSSFCENDDEKCRNYKFNLYKVLFPKSFQQSVLGNKFKKVIEPTLRIDLIDILFVLKSNYDKKKIIDYFMLKLFL